MFLVSKQESDIELANLEHIKYNPPSQELRDNPNIPSGAGHLTTHDHDHRPSSQVGLSITRSADNRDPTSRSCHTIEPLHPEDLQVPSRVHHRTPHHSTTIPVSNNPGASTSERTERIFQSFGIASIQPSHSFDNQPQFFSGQIIPHTGKGKGRIPNSEQQPSIERSEYPYNLLQLRRPPPSLLASFFRSDARFERQQYHQKKYQRPQHQARSAQQ